MINGADHDEDPFKDAKQALIDQLLKVPMNPTQAAISAYANGVLQSARISALVDLVMELAVLPEGSILPDLGARYESLQVEQLHRMTRDLKEAQEGASRIQLASSLKN